MQTKSKPLLIFLFVGSDILFQCCFRFDSCWCSETHVCVVVFLSFDFKFGSSLDLMTQTKSKPLFNFIFVGSNIPKLLFQCCFRFDSCWCLETHVGVWKHMFVL